LQSLLKEAERKGVSSTLATDATLHGVEQLTARRAFEEVAALDDLDDKDRPRTRDEFDAMRRPSRA